MFAIFAAGLWLAAEVEGAARVAVAEYSSEFLPGAIDGTTHLPNDPNDSAFRVYKITHGLENSWDYQHWPAELGAPLDINGQPLIMGDQTLWCVYNDADSAQHLYWESAPLGVEIQQTVFGWLRIREFNDLLFIRWLILNKGVNYLDSMYVGIWCDPDLGDYGDDFVGCDSLNSLGYCYNSSDFDGKYGEHPPAVGFQILQGPILSSPGDTAIYLGRKKTGYKNLPMTSFVRYWVTGPIDGFPQTAQDIYCFMQARWWDGRKIVNDGHMGTGLGPETNYMLSGDPEKGTGWLDFTPDNWSLMDRWFMMSSGPFNLAPGDSQEVVVAAIIAWGSSHLNSVTKLKSSAKIFQKYYNFELYKVLQTYSPETVPTVIKELGLFQNYPNPFNNQTTLRYRLPMARTVRLEIFNSSGQKVVTLVNEHQEPDEYEVVWDASVMASGIYFARLRVAQYDLTRKLLLLK
jgi:hypothetical protein